MRGNNQATPETRRRLLEAAGEIFAEQGFHNATVRDICERAKANIASVNYHFGDKERLYEAVLKYAHGYSVEKYPPLLGLAEAAPGEDRLCAYIRSFLLRIFDDGRPAWHGKLMAREIVDPTGALDVLVEQAFRPQFERLRTIVRDLLGHDADEEQVRHCAGSIIGQCLFYHYGRVVFTRLNPEQRYAREDVERLAGHITRFSLAALKGLASGEGGVPA